jgi:hypothetical protein
MNFENPIVTWEQLPQASKVEYHKLAKAYRTLTIIRAVITSIVLLLIMVFVVIVAQLWQFYVIFSLLGAWLLLFILLMIRPWKLYAHKGYALRENDVLYKSGWLWKRKVAVPYNRIQHVEIRRGPMEELLRLRKLEIYTAGGSSSDLSIPGLDPEQAEKLRSFISLKTGMDEEE